MQKTVQFDTAKLKLFKQEYENAKKLNAHIFVFEDNEYVLGYAKYLIEYLETKLCSPVFSAK